MSLKLLKSAAQMPYISVHAILSQKHPDLYFHFLAHPLLWAHCLRIFQIRALKLNPHEVVFKGQALGDTRCREWNLMIRISVLIKEVPESRLALLPCDGRWLQLWKKQSLTNTSSAGTLVLDFLVSRAARNSLLVSISSPVYGRSMRAIWTAFSPFYLPLRPSFLLLISLPPSSGYKHFNPDSSDERSHVVLGLWAWLISCDTMLSNPTHLPANDTILFIFTLWCMGTTFSLSIHTLTDFQAGHRT